MQDTLREDYPYLFIREPDYSIFIDDIQVTDPTGIALTGKRNYKGLFTLLRFFNRNVFKNHLLTFRINYNPAEQAVQVCWHLKIDSKFSKLGDNGKIFFDGISKYYLNYEGNVYQHEVTNLSVNGKQQEDPIAFIYSYG